MAADLVAKVLCTYCQEEINGVYIQCDVCKNYDECLQCFSSGAQIGEHLREHAYRIIDQTDLNIFGCKNGWTNRQELQLLDAMDKFGFGNWEDVSKIFENKTVEEVKSEFISRYLEGSIGLVTWEEVGDCRPEIKHSPEDKGPLSPEVTARLAPLDIKPEQAEQILYLIHRDDFEKEYDHNAEKLISELVLRITEDSEMEIGLKLALVDIYTRRLRERFRRKRVVRNYQLPAKFFASLEENSDDLTKEQRELRDNMRVFSQFLTAGEHERLIESIDTERELRHRLSELFKYRSLGLTTQAEIVHYEQHAAFQKQQMRQTKAGSSGYGTKMLEGRLENGNEGKDQSFIEEKFMSPQGADQNSNNNLDNTTQTSYKSFLSVHEQQLCTSLNLQPMQYIVLKATIIQEHILSCKGIIPQE